MGFQWVSKPVILNGPVAVIVHSFRQYGTFWGQLYQIYWSWIHSVNNKKCSPGECSFWCNLWGTTHTISVV